MDDEKLLYERQDYRDVNNKIKDPAKYTDNVMSHDKARDLNKHIDDKGKNDNKAMKEDELKKNELKKNHHINENGKVNQHMSDNSDRSNEVLNDKKAKYRTNKYNEDPEREIIKKTSSGTLIIKNGRVIKFTSHDKKTDVGLKDGKAHGLCIVNGKRMTFVNGERK